MTVHQETVHEGTKYFVCDICDYKCSHKTVLKIIQNQFMKGKSATNVICNFGSYRAFDMKNHIQSVHENKKNFSCEIRPHSVLCYN